MKSYLSLIGLLLLNSCFGVPSALQVDHLDKNLNNVETKSFYIYKVKDVKNSEGKNITSGVPTTIKLAMEIKRKISHAVTTQSDYSTIEQALEIAKQQKHDYLLEAKILDWKEGNVMTGGTKIKLAINVYDVNSEKIIYKSILENNCPSGLPSNCINLSEWSNKM